LFCKTTSVKSEFTQVFKSLYWQKRGVVLPAGTASLQRPLGTSTSGSA